VGVVICFSGEELHMMGWVYLVSFSQLFPVRRYGSGLVGGFITGREQCFLFL